MSTSKTPRYTPSPLCLLCSSNINHSLSGSALKTSEEDDEDEDDDDNEEREDSSREDEANDQAKVAREEVNAGDIDPPNGQVIRHIIQKGDTLIGISLKYCVDPHHLCTLNKLPPSTIHTTPHLLQTRSYLLLLPSPPPSLPASTLSQLAHERALARFAKITKEEDPLVRRAYVGVAEIDHEFGLQSESYEGEAEKSKVGAAGRKEEQETVEGRAVGRFFEDLEWEGEQRQDNGQGPRGFPVQSGSSSGVRWKAAGPERATSSSDSKKSWWKNWGTQSEGIADVAASSAVNPFPVKLTTTLPTSLSTFPLDALSSGSEGIKAKWVPAEGNDTKGPLKSLTFTCTAQIPDPNSTSTSTSTSSDAALTPSVSDDPEPLVLCHHRSTHQFSKQAYTQGIVLVQCPGCQNRHLIADHLGWFKEITEGKGSDRLKTIEDIMQEKGEVVKTGVLTEGGVTEIL
ncbi:Uncharacterized conserved protein [Phaffia rhodozyma]|uniref:Uncharacterized conserved protein n=1 Tax=Phaffia rhodozyma TaxID=264483 RepID=A0A0F7SR25_PHARH|nr:Uncharacterized conserved protein [Phaffia rhodozyma]